MAFLYYVVPVRLSSVKAWVNTSVKPIFIVFVKRLAEQIFYAEVIKLLPFSSLFFRRVLTIYPLYGRARLTQRHCKPAALWRFNSAPVIALKLAYYGLLNFFFIVMTDCRIHLVQSGILLQKIYMQIIT